MAFDSFNPAESLIPNDGDLVFDATTGEGGLSPAETVLPYIEQRADPDVVTTPDHADFTLGSPEENDGSSQGIIVNWRTSGPGDELTASFCATGQPSAPGSSQGTGPNGNLSTDFSATGHTGGEGSSQGIIINWTSGPGDELAAGFCATGQPSADGSSQGNTWAGHTAGEGSSQGIIIDWSGPGDELTAGFCATGQTNEDGHVGSGDGGIIAIHPYEESVHTLYDLVM